MQIKISDNTSSIVDAIKNSKSTRQKGKSLTQFIDNYCVVDIETTGLDPKQDDIIEISALRIRNSKIVDKFTTLIVPENFEGLPSFIISLTGITTESILLEGTPIESAIKDFISFIGNDIILGHNINFDINFLYDALAKYTNQQFDSDFIDTLKIARYALPEERHHRLKDLINIFSISDISEHDLHRSINDCKVTKIIYDKLREILGSDWECPSTYSNSKYKFDAKNIIADENKFKENHIFFDKYIVFTGKLNRLTRKSAAQLVADIGGHPQNGINSNTDFLVVGNFDYVKNLKDGMSSKQKKAIEKQLTGQDIKILTEDVFLEQLEQFI